ncbi:sequence orphan Slt1 [Stylosanthes scabra]|uniref:Sequence orphan Slt1 n=1 Tax=Stylosanthes scabra TaxID=79078 RepID=A0ABU6TL76_9FABA|nr:sequence orphan Slt1 [Stylosanthes scabra]
MALDEEDQKRWMELTGRDLNFTIPPEASDFSSWRNLPNTDFELERPPAPIKNAPNSIPKKLLNGSVLNLSTHLSNHSNGDGLDYLQSVEKRGRTFSPTEMKKNATWLLILRLIGHRI